MSAELDQISRRLKKAIEVDDKVILTKDREGIVRYKGSLDGKNGIFYGIELTKGVGKHNGIYKGKTRYFTCKKSKGIFVDKKQILYKRGHEKKRSSIIDTKLPQIFHCEYLKTIHGIWYEKNGIDPIGILLNEYEWEINAENASNWKQRWQLLKGFMMIICDDEYGKLELPPRFIYNSNYEKILIYLVEWLKNEKHLNSRKHILKLLIPFCKTYEIAEIYGNEMAKTLIQKQWKERKYGFRSLVTKALLSIYYSSKCILDEWKTYLIPVICSKSDVRVQVWNFLAQICILGSKTENTYKKQKALLDIETLLCDGKIIQLTKQTINNIDNAKNANYNAISFSCAQFIFGAKYILPEMKSINYIYNEIKQNNTFMRDAEMDEYCQILIKGDNAFDLNQPTVDIIERRKIFNKLTKCDYCNKHSKKLKKISNKIDGTTDDVEDLKDIVNDLRGDNTEYEEELIQLRSEVISMNKKTELLNEDIKEIEIEIFNLKEQIYELQKKEKRMIKMNNKKINKLNLLHWDKWNCDDILQWILSLDNGKYLKYENELHQKLPLENIRGNELYLINETDLIHFGINNIQDRNKLILHIKSLTNNEYIHQINELSPPPMAFNNDLFIPYIGIGPGLNQSHHQQEGIVNDNDND